MDLPKYINILDLDEATNMIKKIEITTMEGKYIMDRSRIKGKDFSEYRKTMLSGDIEKAIQNIIGKLTILESGDPISISSVMLKDISIYQRLNKGAQLIVGEDDNFL